MAELDQWPRTAFRQLEVLAVQATNREAQRRAKQIRGHTGIFSVRPEAMILSHASCPQRWNPTSFRVRVIRPKQFRHTSQIKNSGQRRIQISKVRVPRQSGNSKIGKPWASRVELFQSRFNHHSAPVRLEAQKLRAG